MLPAVITIYSAVDPPPKLLVGESHQPKLCTAECQKTQDQAQVPASAARLHNDNLCASR
jgi:hypothetical protein